MKKLIIGLMMAVVLTGCGSKEPKDSGSKTENEAPKVTEQPGEVIDDDSAAIKDVYTFEYNGVQIPVNTDIAQVLEALGEPQEYFEAKSCAFDGMDKTYFYNGIEITTYPKSDGEDYISSIYFSDDSVSTKEGISLGSSLQEVIAAYGEGYTGNETSYTYNKEDSSIMFIVDGEEVTSITYLAAIEELQ